jgi:hypothetical protein
LECERILPNDYQRGHVEIRHFDRDHGRVHCRHFPLLERQRDRHARHGQ